MKHVLGQYRRNMCNILKEGFVVHDNFGRKRDGCTGAYRGC